MSNAATIAKLLAIILFVSSCSTTVKVQNLGSGNEDEVSGLPFRLLHPYTIRVFAKKPNGEFDQVFMKYMELADPAQLYSINYKSQYFANSTFEVSLREDNTLSGLNTSAESTVPQAFKELGKQSTDIAMAIANYENQRRAAQKETIESEAALLKAKATYLDAEEAPIKDRQARIEAALKALNDAQAMQRDLDALPADASFQERGSLEANLRLAQLRANQAARRAGLDEPYAGVFP